MVPRYFRAAWIAHLAVKAGRHLSSNDDEVRCAIAELAEGDRAAVDAAVRLVLAARDWPSLTKTALATPVRSPFIMAGNLLSRVPKIVTFGLSPRGAKEQLSTSMDDEFRWRMHYFNAPNTQPLHRTCRQVIDAYWARRSPERGWSDCEGYVTMDLFPWYLENGRRKGPDYRRSDSAFAVVSEHFRECLRLLGRHTIAGALISGRDWEKLLLGCDGCPQLARVDIDRSFTLAEITDESRLKSSPGFRRIRENTRCYIGTVVAQVDGQTMELSPALLISWLIQMIPGFSVEDASRLGEQMAGVVSGT